MIPSYVYVFTSGFFSSPLYVSSAHAPEGIKLQHFKGKGACNKLLNLYSIQ